MNTLALPAPRTRPLISTAALVWIAVFIATFALYRMRESLPALQSYPATAIIPFADWISAIMNWLRDHLTWFTRSITAIVNVPLSIVTGLLAKGLPVSLFGLTFKIPQLSWVGIIIAVAMAGLATGDRRTALLGTACFLYIAIFGQWQSAMLTLALIILCVPLCVVIGVLAGIAAQRSPVVKRAVVLPLLDLMQTVPTFAYLVPMLLLFGNNPVSALLATAIYAVPPMVRVTMLALERVPQEIDEFGTMAGCTRRQKMWSVLLPSARPMLMVGVNQVIMLALNMVIIASMIGAGGLGYDVLLALRALKIGAALEAGLAIVALAIALDRLSQAFAARRPTAFSTAAVWRRHPYLLAALAAVIITTALSQWLPALASVPKSITLSTAPMWKELVDWITKNYFDVIELFRTFVLLNVLNPVKQFLLALPWPGVVAMIGLAGLQLGGVRLAALVVALTMFCAVSGLWDKTMTTIYLCGISSIIAALLGIPLGVWAARNANANRIIQPLIDTLQTMPSFVFLIPVVMLFRVGDVTAMIAVVSFAIAPAVRYTYHGITSIPPTLVESALVSGCTRRQLLWKVQLPLALPEIMLGINQTILLALSMLIITAMVGTRDLGQEVFIALAKADSGRGIVAGLAVAFIGIVADRLMGAWSNRTRQRLGLSAATS